MSVATMYRQFSYNKIQQKCQYFKAFRYMPCHLQYCDKWFSIKGAYVILLDQDRTFGFMVCLFFVNKFNSLLFYCSPTLLAEYAYVLAVGVSDMLLLKLYFARVVLIDLLVL